MTTIKNNVDSSSHGESSVGGGVVGGGVPPPQLQTSQPDHQQHSRDGNTVFKSGPLFISSKGIGWTSWKKRWFILTKTSLVFFRSDPNAAPQKSGEVNLTLGGIDLNNSGSVVVKADKKLITVQFPDGRDGRTFTLKAETLEDLYDWQKALESALSQAPSASLMMGQNGILKNETTEGADNSSKELKDEEPGKSLVLRRPILLALEEVDGTPSFLEKALRFIEEHGINTEGILRQAADVEAVERRIREYEQGKTEFSPDEDAHVIGDCIKYVLRELPSSPVPASCCNALIEACRTDRSNRVNAMREGICETFPEPNRKLLQRILLMMQAVASNKAKNRMSSSAVSACMAPLLLRPLLAGDCEIETDFDVGGDGSIQLLKAAAAANHAQAIVITLLEEYDNIFNEGSMSPGLYSDSDEYGSEEEELTDDYEDDGSYEDSEHEGSEGYTEDDNAQSRTGTGSGSGSGSVNESGSCDSGEDNLSDNKGLDGIISSDTESPKVDEDSNTFEKLSSGSVQTSSSSYNDVERSKTIENARNDDPAKRISKSHEQLQDVPEDITLDDQPTGFIASPCIQKSTTMSNGPEHGTRRRHVWGRTSAKKNLSMESIEYHHVEEETEIRKLEDCKIELQNKISKEVKGNAILEANLEQRKQALHDRRMALERHVERLRQELQREKDKRQALESGLDSSKRPLPVPFVVDEKLRMDLEEIYQAEADVTKLEQRVNDLNMQLNRHREPNCDPAQNSSNQPASDNQAKQKDKHRDSEAVPTSRRFGRSRSKSKSDGSGSDKIYLSQSLQNDIMEHGIGTDSKTSKRSIPRTEGSNSTSSALTKLSTRLNFLKERRTQIANEIQSMDKCPRGSGQAVTSPPDSRQGLEPLELSQNQDSGQNLSQQGTGLKASKSSQNSEK